MFNSINEEDPTQPKLVTARSMVPDSQRLSERDAINFSQNSSRRQKHSSQSNFSKDLNSNRSDSFMFLRSRVDSKDNMNHISQSQLGLAEYPKRIGTTLLGSGSGGLSKTVLNKLDVNTFANSHSNFQHKLSDMFCQDSCKSRPLDQAKCDYNLLEKRSDNRTSIFQTQLRGRHLDGRKHPSDAVFAQEARSKEDALGHVTSHPIERVSAKNPKPNVCTSIQRNQVNADDLAQRVDASNDNLKIASFGKMLSGFECFAPKDNTCTFDPDSMAHFEKPAYQLKASEQARHELRLEHSVSESRKSLASDLNLSLSNMNRLRLKGQSDSFKKKQQLFTSKVNLGEIYSEDNRFTRGQKRAEDERKQRELSEVSGLRRNSDLESMYISELNDNNSKDRLLLQVLMDNTRKRVKINTLNTNFNTVNNNNNNLNYITGARPGISQNEIDFVKYLNNVKNYYIDPLSKSIFLKIGTDESEEDRQQESPGSGQEVQNTQLVPLVNFMHTGRNLTDALQKQVHSSNRESSECS